MAKGSEKGYSGTVMYAKKVHSLTSRVDQNQLLELCYDPAFILALDDLSIVNQNESFTQLLISAGYSSSTKLTQIIPKYQPNGQSTSTILNDYKNKLLLTKKSQRFDISVRNLKSKSLNSIEVTISAFAENSSIFLCMVRRDNTATSILKPAVTVSKPEIITSEDQTVSTEMLIQKLNEYRSIVDSSPAAIIKTDLAGNINFVSTQAKFIHGLPEEELLFKHIDDFFNIKGKSFTALLKRKLDDQKKGQGNKTLSITHPIKGERTLNLKYYSINTEGSRGYLLSYVDISDKEKIKSSLEDSKAKLDSIIGLSNSDIIQLSKDGIIESISSNFNSLNHKKECDIIGQKFSSFLSPESKDLFKHCKGKLTQDSSENISEFFEVQFPNQEKKLIQVFGKMLVDKTKNKESFLFVCHNYNDKIKSEIALIEKESTVHTLLENSPFSIYAIDRQLNVIFINNNAIQDFKTFQNIDIKLGDNLTDIVPKKDLKNWKNKIFKRVFAGEKFSRTGLINGVKDVIIENKYAPLIDHYGNVSGCVEVSQDITDLKLKEYQLIEREAYLSSILNSSPNGIIVFDSENNVTGINPKAIENFSAIYNQEIDINLNLKNILSAPVFKTIDGIRDRVFKGEVVSYSEKVVTKANCLYFDHIFSPVMDKGNTIIGCKLLIKDETKAIEFEDILRQKNKELELYIESNLSLENFANIASHDLKSPLRTIIGFTQLLHREINKDLSERNKVFLMHIIKSSKNMQELIDDILQFSKLNSIEPTIEEIPFKLFIEFIISQIQEEVNERQSIIKFKNLPKYIYSDKVKLTQVIQNLIRNGIKFQKENSQAEITISVDDLENYWQINIADNGIGIEQKHADEIFQIFKRIHHKGDYPGNGIGLSTCQKIVESLDGKIWVNSVLGKGSIFSFTIPK